jgi:hypothetical protein
VQQHLSPTQSVAAGLRALPRTNKPFAATQAAWRFFANERITLPLLGEPIITQARELSSVYSSRYSLVMHDFSDLKFTTHENKKDRIRLCNNLEFGYFLQAALFVSDIDGSPLAPLYIGLEAADGVHSSRRETPLPPRRQLDELNRTFGYIEAIGLAKRCVHLVDRQADSLLHLRRFARCGRKFVIRSNDVRRVRHQGASKLLREVEESLQNELKYVRQVEHRGKRAWQYVAETIVVMEQMGRTKRPTATAPSKRQLIKGKPLELRLVVSEVRDKDGKVLSTWRLWTNVEAEVAGQEIALWYYWRWKIESFFKLLKKGGQQIEQWQQESAEAIAKRLLVVAQTCVLVWTLAISKEEKAGEIREFLVSLSGRQMKRGVAYTASALLVGMWQFLAIIDALERHTTAELREMANELLRLLGSELNFKDVKELV